MIETTNIETVSFFKNAVNNSAISAERKSILHEVSKKIATVFNEGDSVNINFICTHNSRRSQLGQVWVFFAVEYFKLQNIFSFSGGTEVTAFYKNTGRNRQKGVCF